MQTKWFRIGLILMILFTPLGGIQKSVPVLAQDAQPPTEASASSLAAPRAAASPVTPNCALLDDPVRRSMLSGALETALIYACGRETELAFRAPAAVAATVRPQAATALGDNVLVNDPTGEMTSTVQNNAVIAYNADTGILCSAYTDSYHGVVQGTGYTGFSSSADGGATWVDRGALDANSYGYPSLTWRRADGHFYLATLRSNGLGMWDLGAGCEAATWVGMIHTGVSDDKEMLTVDNNPSSPYYGRLYTAWTDFTNWHIYVARSGDGGQIWSAPVDVSAHDQVNGAWAAVDPATGDVYAAWTHWDAYPNGPIDVEMARSTDGGATWNPLVNPMSDQVNPRDATATATCGRPALNGDIRYFPYPQIAVGPNGVLHAVYSYDPNGYNTGDVVNIYYRRSLDQGTNWEPEIRVNDNWSSTDQFSPALAVGETGAIGVFWYDRRLDSANNLLYDRYIAVSRDGGQGFGANQRISDESSPVTHDAALATCYHGDYDGAAAGGGAFYTVWGDDRRGDADVWSDTEAYFWGELTGTVYDANTRRGLEGAHVETVHAATGIAYSAAGDVGGNYAMTLPGGGNYAVTAQVYGYAPNTVAVVVDEDGGRADIPLTPVADWSINGAVLDAVTGYPVYAHVTVSGAPFNPPAPNNETWSDPFTGGYNLPHLAAAIAYTLTFEATGYIPLVYFAGELDANLTNPDLTLQPDLTACTAPGYEMAPPCQVATGAILWPELLQTDGCPGTAQSHDLAFVNHTGADETVLITYTASAGATVVDIPATLGAVSNHSTRPFETQIQIDKGVSLNAPVYVTVTAYLASNPAISDTTLIEKRAALLEQPWETEPDAPVTAFYRAAGATLDDYAYVIGGQNSGVALNHVARYRPDHGWQTLSNKPTAAANIDVAELNGKIYAAGGYDNGAYLTAFEVLDPERPFGSQWTVLTATLPVATSSGAMAAACGNIYLMGGNPGIDTPTHTVYMYNPNNPVAGWSAAATMPQTQRYAAGVTVRGLIFTVGDWDTGTRVQVYDCAADAWLPGYPQLTISREAPGVAVIRNRYIVAYGGAPAMTFDGQTAVEILDLDNLAAGWQVGPPMHQARMGQGGGIAGGRLIAIGGMDENSIATNTTESIALCPECSNGVSIAKSGPEWAYTGDVISYTVAITRPNWLTGTATLADALPAGVDFAGGLNASAGTAWYSDTARTVYWTAPAPVSAPTTPGTVIETFTNTWAADASGLEYNPEGDFVRYAHESGSGIFDVAYPAPHPALHSFNLSTVNSGWPQPLDNHNGVGYDHTTGHYFLPDYQGDLSARNDNIVEIDPGGHILNAWETDGASNDSYDGSSINQILDIAVVPGTPTRYFATAYGDGGLVYELNLHKVGKFVADTWGKVMTCTVPGIGNTSGIDYDAQNGVLYHSDWSSRNIVVTDLACNVLDSFTCDTAETGIGAGVTFIEGQWPPEVWVANYGSDRTTRCEAVGREPLPEVVTVTFNVTVTAPASTTITNMASFQYRGIGAAPAAPAVDTYYVAGTWNDDAVHLLDASLDDLGSFPAGATRPNGMATDGVTIWSGHYNPQVVVAYNFAGQELYRWSANLSGLQGMELVNGELAIYRNMSIGFHNPQTGALIRTIPGHGGIEGLAFDGKLLWELDGNYIYGIDLIDGSAAITITNAASGCMYEGTGLAAGAPGVLTLSCTDGKWFQVSSADGSVIVTGTNGLNMFGLAYVPPQRAMGTAAFHVAPRTAVTWTKEVYVNGNYLGRHDEGPFTVVPADDVQIVDRLDYVGREPLFVQLTEDWAGQPVTMTEEYHTHGMVTGTDGDWYATLPPNTTARLVKTLHITDTVPVTIHEWLYPEGLPSEERGVTFQPPAFVKDGPAVVYNGQLITYTITYTSQNPLMGSLRLTDTLPPSAEIVGLTASYGNVYYESISNSIYWTNSPSAEITRRTLNTPAAGTTSHAAPAVRSTSALLASASPSLALAPSASWYNAAPLPQGTVRYAHTQCPGDPNRFYVIAGVTDGHGSDKMRRYDADADGWTELAAFPSPGEGSAAVCYQGRIYVAGGSGGMSRFYIYDIAQDTWAEGPGLPRAVWGAAMGVWDGRIFLAGGDNDFAFGGQSGEVDIYDIAAGTWYTNGAAMPAATSASGWTQVNEYLYVVGGWGDTMANNITATQRYNMAFDYWSIGSPFASGRGDFALAATGQYLYAIGGDADGGGPWDAITLTERLDYTHWSGAAWTDIADPLPTALTAYGGSFCTTAKSGGEIWSTGGMIPASWSYAATHQYRPSEPCVTIPASVVITFTARVDAGAGERVTNTAQMNVHGSILTAASAFDVPLPDWQKLVNGAPWQPGFALPVADGDLVTVTDVVSTPSRFGLRETWDPERLELISYSTPATGTVVERPWQMGSTTPFAYYRFDAEYSNAARRVYFLGGRLANGSTTGRIWEFDPATGVYSDTGVDMPHPISNYNIARLTDSNGDEVLVTFGGRLGATNAVTDVVQGFYPLSSTVVIFNADPYPTATSPGGVAVVDNIAYVFGGFDAAVVTSTTYIFDIAAADGNRWTSGPALNKARTYIGAAVVDGVIYAIGGDDYSGALIPLTITERLDTANPVAWDDAGVADLPVACDQMPAFGFDTDAPNALAGSIAVAGCGRHPNEYADGLRYDVAANAWDEAFPDLNQARRNHAGAFIPDGAGTGMPGLWVWGGRQSYDGNLLSAVEYYPLGEGILSWSVPAGTSEPLALTKVFRVQPGLWPPTTLNELLGISTWSETRPVIIAKEQPTFYTLTVATAGTGSGVITPAAGDYYYLAGASVTLTATANPGSTFVGWSGDVSGTNPTATVVMDGNKTATAVFNLEGVCVDVTGVALTLLTAGDLYTDTAVQFRAVVSPATAIPYTYTVNYGAGASAPAATLNNPLTLFHTFPTTGSKSIVFAAWSCTMTTPISASVPVTILGRETAGYVLYLPMVLRAYNP